MNTEKFSQAMGEIDSRYVEEAIHYRKGGGKRFVRIKWTAAAACIAAAVVVLAAGLLSGRWFGGSREVAVLENGDQIVFVRKDADELSFLSLDMDVTTRHLTDEETRALFADLPVSADAVFSAGDGKALLGLQGTIGDAKLVVETAGETLRDTIVEGEETSSEVGGTSVTAGYLVTDPNSRGEQTVIYYAEFQLGGSTVYVEHAGAKAESEQIKNDLAEIIQDLIGHGALPLELITGGETITDAR